MSGLFRFFRRQEALCVEKNVDAPIFTPLCPISDIEDLGIYKDALDFALSNEEVRNIALSGAYGSGKSSILATYEKQTNKKFLHISLAHFATQKTDKEVRKENDASPNDNEKNVSLIKQTTSNSSISTLEWKILNQLIHQINPSKIPQTNFRVKKKTSKFGLVWISVLILVFLSSFLYTLLFNEWISFYNTITTGWIMRFLHFSTFSDFRLITLLTCVVLAGVGLFRLLLLQRDRRVIKRLDVKGAEIEMFADEDESYFDKYLNEVLYLFESAEQTVIVFEDLDRFDSYMIFERLREVNSLVNYSRKPNAVQRLFLNLNKSKNKIVHLFLKMMGKEGYKFPPIRFFYLLRDDVFSNKDRIKFFDLVIPVVPIVDGSNSYDKFIEVFEEHEILDHFQQTFLQGFSFYIDEMRLLLNICNEYKVYYRQIGNLGTEIDRNKLLAMIAFKNLFPHDFSELQLGRGFVFKLLTSKNELIHTEREHFNNEINVCKTMIEHAKKEHLQLDREADILYSNELRQLSGIFETHYRELRQNKNPLQQTLADRKINIANRSEEVQIALLDRISKLEQQIEILSSKRIKDLLQGDNKIFESLKYTNPIGKEYYFEKVKKNEYFKLLIFFIRRGYIDETYKDYMTYFYPNSLTANDAAFCRSVTDQNSKLPEYIIENPAMVLKRLPAEYFNQKEVLNYSLLNYLLAEKNPSKQLSLLIKQLAEIDSYDFICGYFTIGSELEKFVTVMNIARPTLFYELLSPQKLNNDYLNIFARYTLYDSPDEVIHAANVNGCLTEFISKNSSFLSIDTLRIDRILHGLKLLEVSFLSIEAYTANPKLLNGVYENSLYKITFPNISIMLHKFYNLEVNNEFTHRNYSLILSNPDSPLATFVNENIVDYITEILENCENEITDDEAVALEVLNNENIPTNLKQRYISLLKTRLTALSEVNDSMLWEELLKSNDVIAYSENNVIDYCFFVGGIFDDILVEWVNQQTSSLDFSDDGFFNGENDKRDLFQDTILQCGSLNNSKYKEFSTTIGRIYIKFSFDSIEESKMNILVENDIIEMNAENLLFVRDNYSFAVLCNFIIKNILIYIQIIEEQNDILQTNELEYLVSTKSGVSEDKQIRLLSLISGELSIRDKSYAEPIILHILSHNFSENDYELLVKGYETFSKDIREKIVGLFVDRTEHTIELKYPISKTLFDDLANREQLDEGKLRLILALALPNIGELDCIEYLTAYGLDQFADIFDMNKKPQFDDTEPNKFVLDCFLQWGKIKGYNVRENGKIHIKRNNEFAIGKGTAAKTRGRNDFSER